MANPDVLLTLDEGVAEVLGILTGLDLNYAPTADRYVSTTRAINRALRSNALEHEWSYYSDYEDVDYARVGVSEIFLRGSIRPRIINDDQVQLCRGETPVLWAAFIERSALSKYAHRAELWCSSTRSTLKFNRPFHQGEDGLMIRVPVMREPRMLRLPDQPEDPSEDLVEVPAAVRAQTIDFDYPDLATLRAAFYIAQADPVMQPRAQTLEAQYKDLMYQLIERDDRNTDSTYLNEWTVPIEGSLRGNDSPRSHGHPHADTRGYV